MLVQALDDFADHFVAGVIPHPSIHVEDYLGRSAVALCEKAKRPILLMPAGGVAVLCCAVPWAVLCCAVLCCAVL